MKDLITIVVPVYNTEKYIARCLDSILNQTYKNLEIIVINDGSPDKSLELIKGYQEKDSRIIIIDKKNAGVSAARNDGIAKSSGKYIMFIDSDDWINLKMVEELLFEIKESNSEVAKATYMKDFIYKQEIILIDIKEEKLLLDKSNIKEELYYKMLTGYYFNNMWGQLIKTSVIKDNNIKFNSNYTYGEDALFCQDLYSKVQNMVLINKPYYHYFFNTTSITTTMNMEKIRIRCINAIEIYSRLYDFIIACNINSDYEKQLVANRVLRETALRSREFLLVDNKKEDIIAELNNIWNHPLIKESIKVNGNSPINIIGIENNIYAKLLLKGNIKLFLNFGRTLFKSKRILKKILKKN